MLKDLKTYTRDKVEVTAPVSKSELVRMKNNPQELKEYLSKNTRKKDPYRSVSINYNGQDYDIQVNRCTNPFCDWFGLNQISLFGNDKRPFRYRIVKAGGGTHKRSLSCNTWEDHRIESSDSIILSNWALANEIRKLVSINNLKGHDIEYSFHKEGCMHQSLNPFDNPDDFYKRGVSSSKSPRRECKYCGKITNLRPERKDSFTYSQKNTNINRDIFNQIIGKQPIRRKLEELGIGASTYYYRLHYIYERCLEFQQRHEKKLGDIKFNELRLESDVFNYTMRNTRKRGSGYGTAPEDFIMKTNAIGTVDARSRYLFRFDIAYDYEMTAEKLQYQFDEYMEYDLFDYSRKNAHYRIGGYGGQDKDIYPIGKEEITTLLKNRKSYIDGFHTIMTYTACAHYWLLDKTLNARVISITTDRDALLKSAINRIFAERIKSGTLHHLTQSIDKGLSTKEANACFINNRRYLASLVSDGVYPSIDTAARALLKADILANAIHQTSKKSNGKYQTIPREFEHPLPRRDQPNKRISLQTPATYLSIRELVDLLYHGDLGVIDGMFQYIRRHSFIVERPLSGPNNGNIYIYTNINPKYAHYVFVILRTFYNFVDTQKYSSGQVTPAMRLGIANKPYTIEDILYIK